MKISPIYSYNTNSIYFKNRNRMHPVKDKVITLEYPEACDSLYSYYKATDGKIPKEYRTKDSFTNLRDKTYLLAVLNNSIFESIEKGKDLSFAMFDMDNFKSINELLGYETGDDIIKEISKTIKETAKANDVKAYRFGGEEFVILFDKQNKEEKQKIVDKVLKCVNSNFKIKSQESIYKRNAKEKMFEYSISTEKITTLEELKSKKKLYDDLRANLDTYEAKNDPYLLKCIKEVDEKLNATYIYLISERLKEEDDSDIRSLLLRLINRGCSDRIYMSKEEQKALDEYLKFKYDKSPELFQLRKWMYTFETNNGFSMTGCVVNFDKNTLKNKTPMNLINIAGEVLKRGKQTKKGQSYYDKVKT